jgi:hypothetical protein
VNDSPGSGANLSLHRQDVRPRACASIFQTPLCFANVYARVPVRTTDWPLIVTVRRPEMTA